MEKGNMPPKGSKSKTPYRKHGEGSIRQRPNGLWIVRVDRVIDGVRKPIQYTSMDFDVVMEKFEAAKSDLRRFGHVADPKMTVTTWTERWLNDVTKPNLRPDTWTSYASLIRKWVQPTLGHLKLGEVKPADVRRIRTVMLAPDPKTGRAASTSTILKAFRVFSKCMEDARKEDLVTENVVNKVDPPRKAVSTRSSFTVAQVRELLLAAAAEPMGSRYAAALLMGVRQSEAIGLTIDCLHLDDEVAEIKWQLQEIPWDHTCGTRSDDGVYPCGFKQAARCPTKVRRVPDGYDFRMLAGNFALVPTKSRSTPIRHVPIIPPLAAALRLHLANTSHIPNPHGLVWRQADGSPIPHKVDQEGWRQLVVSVGLPKECTTHWARHSVATLLMEAGVDAKVVGEIVGHGSVAVTRGVYQHVTTQFARDGLGKLGELLAGN